MFDRGCGITFCSIIGSVFIVGFNEFLVCWAWFVLPPAVLVARPSEVDFAEVKQFEWCVAEASGEGSDSELHAISVTNLTVTQQHD